MGDTDGAPGYRQLEVEGSWKARKGNKQARLARQAGYDVKKPQFPCLSDGTLATVSGLST